MSVGDVVKWSKAHSSQPGYAYTENWIGIVLKIVNSTFIDHPATAVEIMWLVHGETQVSRYDESYWNSLGYDPFEVLCERG